MVGVSTPLGREDSVGVDDFSQGGAVVLSARALESKCLVSNLASTTY